MGTRAWDTKWLVSPLWAGMIGLLASIPAFAGCLFLAGAGHGLYVPAFLFFGPACILWTSEFGDQLSNFGLLICFLGSYCLYGWVLAIGRLCGRGVVALWVVVLTHYGAFFWLWAVPPARTGWDSAGQFEQWLTEDPFFVAPLLIGMFELLVILHVVACQYATSACPYRPRVTKTVIAVLLVGLVSGLLVCGLTVW